jgi:hypothetical protein
MGALTTAIAQMAAKFNAMKTEVLDLLTRKPKTSLAADNALAMQNGDTSTSIVNAGRAVANTHITNYLNPHGVTAVGVGGMLSSDVDLGLANRIPEGILPISRYGDLDGTAISVTSSGLTVTWAAQVHAVMMGYSRPLPAFSQTLQPNTTYNVYVRFNGSATSYFFSIEDLAETTTRMWIGRIVTGASTVSSIAINRVTRIDTYRTSAAPIGSAVPVTVGTPNNAQTLAAGWF